MRPLNLGCLALLALSACAAPQKLTTEQWRERLLIGKVNGKDLYAASQFNRSVFEGLGIVARRFGLRPGIALKDQGYPSGIPIEIRNFPGVI